MNSDDSQLKELKKFKTQFEKLLAKYPNLMVYGDRDGDISVSSITGNTRLQVYLNSTANKNKLI